MHTIEEIAALLHIQEKAHANGDLGNIASSALNRLRMINEEMGAHGLGSEKPTATPEPTQTDAELKAELEKEPSDV